MITVTARGLILSAGVASSYAFGDLAWGPRGALTPEARADYSANRKAAQTAIEQNNYAAWQTAVADQKISQFIDSQEKFDKLVAAHAAMQSGDLETAKALHQELGWPGSHPLGRGKGLGAQLPFNDANGDGICDFADLQDQ